MVVMNVNQFFGYAEDLYYECRKDIEKRLGEDVSIEDLKLQFGRLAGDIDDLDSVYERSKEFIIQTMLFRDIIDPDIGSKPPAVFHVKQIFEGIVDTLHRKNADYSASNEDPFRNFDMVVSYGIVSGPRGILVRMCDKMSRIENLLSKEPDVLDETQEDTLVDMVGYTAILASYCERERRLNNAEGF